VNQAAPLTLPVSVAAHFVMGGSTHDDETAYLLQKYQEDGYREVEWQYGFEEWQNTKLWQEMGSVCPPCFALDGQHFKIKWLLENMHHNAPLFSLSHVNCGCTFKLVNRTDELLDFSETMDVAPGEISDSFKDTPIGLDEVPPELRTQMGLPAEQNESTDIEWQWDATRNEFVPLKTLRDQAEDTGEYVFDAASGKFIPGGS
jgi:hypothetical protein